MRTAQEKDMARILAEFKRMLSSMLCLGQDKNGYPTDGIDLVPERPKLQEPLNEPVKLLQQANDREDTLKQSQTLASKI